MSQRVRYLVVRNFVTSIYFLHEPKKNEITIELLSLIFFSLRILVHLRVTGVGTYSGLPDIFWVVYVISLKRRDVRLGDFYDNICAK